MNNRRRVLRWIGLGVGSLMGLLPALTRSRSSVAVSQSSPTPAAPTFEKVGTLADLKEGQLLIEKESKFAPVLLIQDAKDAKVVYAVDPTCPHAGCTVEHKAGGTELACPCHGSKFGLDGAVTKGPAKKPLPTYAVKLEGDTILLAKAS